MRSARNRWWFLNPIEWLKNIYETFGLKHPTGSMIVVVVLSAIAGGVVWTLAANLVAKEHSKKAEEPLQDESPEYEILSVQAQVYFPYTSPALRLQLDEPKPFVELQTDIINGSPVDLVATGIEGRLTWDGIEFQQSVKVAGDMRLFKSGGRAAIIIQQPIHTQETSRLKTLKSVVFTPVPLLLYLTYTDKYGKSRTFTKQIPWESSHAWHF
jgi:hypothetical protein